MTTLNQHPLSAAWPAMQDDEFHSLKDSILVIGVQNPITIFEGMVIDGWHRYRAATELGMACPSKPLGDVDPVDFVRAQNDARRHITGSQKALAITAIYMWKPVGANQHQGGWEPGSHPQKSNSELASIAGVSDKTIKQAKAVQANATPEVKAAVKAGTMSVKKAAETTKPPKPAPAVTEPTLQAPTEDEGAPDDAELEASRIHQEAQAKTIAFMLASDEPLADLAARNTQLEAQIIQLNLRMAGLQNSNNEYIKRIKSLQNQLKKVQP